ncbi:putative ATPase [Variovorax boronicumulans]|uniref:AAA family ATPase n=1 Tax=Variovorax boronicumulans TaxID=436515 RepID=UPI0027837B36|nr:AAA family ATPase [Variovorax boronicumulans]MDQ0038186.1 putative ATPase [Variovorax boronicumulans]
MFINSVKTPRGIEVHFGLADPSRSNQISLLTGPNGSGKTDVLASIAQVFHGDPRILSGAEVRWNKGSKFKGSVIPISEFDSNGDYDDDYERINLIAQTFSPFSRFPAARRIFSPYLAPIYARGDDSKEDYACIGFNQKSHVKLSKIPFSILENGILRLSERPRTARVAFDVLRELDFKNGIEFTYLSSKYLTAMINVADDSDRLEKILENFAKTGIFTVDGHYYGKSILRRLLQELRAGNVGETIEYLRHAFNMIGEFSIPSRLTRGEWLKAYKYAAFRGQESMSSDFPYLQAFSVLSRLELIRVVGCELYPIGGGPVDLTRTSSGQQQMLCSIFGLAAALEDHSVVLIDEPELSLHPRWQMNFLKHLETALEAVSNCHVLIATHSPLIVQAASEYGVQVISMGNKSNAQKAKYFAPNASNSVEEMLVDVFHTPIPNSLHISNEIFSLVTKAESGTHADKHDSMVQLTKYLTLYQQQGEGSRQMANLLAKALNLVDSAIPARE